MRCADEAGQSVPTGEAGEVLLRDYHVMQGYFYDDETPRPKRLTPMDGAAHRRGGCACVVLRAGRELNGEVLVAWARANMANHKGRAM